MNKQVYAAEADPAKPENTECGDDQKSTAVCSSCGGTGLAATRISTAFRSGEHWAVIKDIPALVCRTCREEFVDDATAVRLDMMRANGFSSQEASETMTVPVYAFPSDNGNGS